ncbi:hypothetical protein [Acidipropionibacterium acidipropionici]|nr:hypothetical protein [Acidipropionibacterium acidipropionici]
MTIGEYSGAQDVELHADQTPLGALLVDRCGRIEEILACAGISRPLAWHQETWDPVISLYVRKDWCYCDAAVDEDAWRDAEERIRAEIEWPVRLVEVTTGGAQAMVGLQALAAAVPWAGTDLTWVHDLENTMRAGLMTWADLAAQMENRLREAVG